MRRMVDETDDSFELALLRSAKGDAAPSDSAEKAAIALAGAVILGVAASSTAAATATATGTAKAAKASALAGKLGVIAIWKWIGLGVIVGSAVTMSAEHVVRHADPSAHRVATAEPPSNPITSSNPSRLPELLEGQGEGPPAVVELSPPVPIAPIASAPIRAPHVEAPPPSAAAISAEIAALAAPPAIAPSASAVPVSVPAPNASALALEVASLDRARRALAAKDPAEAIRLLDVYEREVPVRVLGPEAQVLRIEAVAARGDRAEAKRLGEQFLIVYPRDPHADRVRRLLATMSNL